MNEVEASQAQERGARATALLENDLLKECFEALRADYLDTWKRTHYKEVEGRERLFLAYQIVGKVEDHLKKIAVNGRIATRDLSQIKNLTR